MRLNTSQQFRLEQQMKLAPRIIQAMEILQLPIMALQERIDAEIEKNPVLEDNDLLGEQETQAPDDEVNPERDLVVGEQAGGEEFQRLAQFESAYEGEFDARDESRPRSGTRDSGDRDKKLDAMANTEAPQQSLQDYLLQQWAFVEAAQPINDAGKIIIERIEEDGYLRTPLDELAKLATPPVPVETLLAALRLVQTLDPIGVGARDLRECLLIQLAAEKQAGRDVTLETELVGGYLQDIEMNRLPAIARRTGRTVQEITAAIANLSHLNPRPGALVGPHVVQMIVPDVIIDIDEHDQIVIDMPHGNMPRLHISKDYQKMAGDKSADRVARQFIRNNIRSAEWLMGAIEQRRHTVRRVVEEVFKVQRDFLYEGRQALKPLPMVDVANKVGVHVATVSRAVSGKYVQTPRGVYPLRMFFSGGTTTADGEDVSWDAVKVKLKELVEHEDKHNPLNDDELADAIVKQGIEIKRRTVAKYRSLLNIPPARKRKQF